MPKYILQLLEPHAPKGVGGVIFAVALPILCLINIYSVLVRQSLATYSAKGQVLLWAGIWLFGMQFWLPPQFDSHEPFSPRIALIYLAALTEMIGIWLILKSRPVTTAANAEPPEGWPPVPSDANSH